MSRYIRFDTVSPKIFWRSRNIFRSRLRNLSVENRKEVEKRLRNRRKRRNKRKIFMVFRLFRLFRLFRNLERLRRALRLSARLAEENDHFAVEGRNVIRFAAR